MAIAYLSGDCGVLQEWLVHDGEVVAGVVPAGLGELAQRRLVETRRAPHFRRVRKGAAAHRPAASEAGEYPVLGPRLLCKIWSLGRYRIQYRTRFRCQTRQTSINCSKFFHCEVVHKRIDPRPCESEFTHALLNFQRFAEHN